MQLIYRPDTGEILGVHIFGMHAADLIHEASNAIAMGTRIQVDFAFKFAFASTSGMTNNLLMGPRMHVAIQTDSTQNAYRVIKMQVKSLRQPNTHTWTYLYL